MCVVSLKVGRGDRPDVGGGEVKGRLDELLRKNVLDAAGFEGDRGRGRIDVLTIGRTRYTSTH